MIAQSPDDFLQSTGQVFAVFDERTQDSGNISYGVLAGARRFFVKTAGMPENSKAHLSHEQRVALLRNAVSFRQQVNHHSLPKLLNVIESPHGPMLVYEWVPGELLAVERSRRADPASPFQRFRALPFSDLLTGLNVVFDFHRSAAELGWVAVDFYDGAMIYDFATQAMRLIDLDNYRDRPFTNEMGRMFGSTRFMAPEEFELGAIIDEVTTVFTRGRVISVFLSDGTLELTPYWVPRVAPHPKALCWRPHSRAGVRQRLLHLFSKDHQSRARLKCRSATGKTVVALIFQRP
ncbi:MAG: serine/threonine-protein kinase [Acidobacteria bacterium]|nr:serine/threonine-protein kinase [Acidobacteriota bacterium]